MKLFAFIFVLGAFAEESLISGVELVACPTADGDEMCTGGGRPVGSLACANLSQEVKDATGAYYDVGFNCMCTGFWKYSANNGHNIPIMGAATHNCATTYIGTSTNWNLADFVSDLNGGEFSTMCTK